MQLIAVHAQEEILYSAEKPVIQESRKTVKMPNILYPGFTCNIYILQILRLSLFDLKISAFQAGRLFS